MARSGKYKVLLLVAVTLLGLGSYLFREACGDHPRTRPSGSGGSRMGIGIGPTLAVFTIVVQNAVPFSKLGVATSNLTFFRQIGGTVSPG